MTIVLKFDDSKTIVKHEAFSEGIILGIATTNESGDMLEQEPLFLINGFTFAYAKAAYTPDSKVYPVNGNVSAMKEFEDARKYFGNYMELGLNNVPEVRLKRALEFLSVGPDAKAYIKALVESTKK